MCPDSFLYRQTNCKHCKGFHKTFFDNVLLKVNSALVCFRICIVLRTDTGAVSCVLIMVSFKLYLPVLLI